MSTNYNFTEYQQPFVTKAEQYCAQGEHCCSEVKGKLLAWGAGIELAQVIVDHLVLNKYIDEERFCRTYCDSKLRLMKWGRIKIAYQLRSKRIEERLIAQSIDGLDQAVYDETLHNLAENKLDTIKDTDPRKRYAKAMAFLTSHGFTAEESDSVLRTKILNT